jgi:membrane protein required for colicin V production
MNLLDIIIITILSSFLLIGIWRGFFRAAAFFAGIVLGLWLGMTYTNNLAALVKPQIPTLPDSAIQIICFSLLFVVIIILSNFVGWALKHLFKKVFLGWLDRLLGTFFALGGGIILIYLMIVVLTFFLPAQTPLIANSKLSPWIIKSYQSMVRLISPEHYRQLKRIFTSNFRGPSGPEPKPVVKR